MLYVSWVRQGLRGSLGSCRFRFGRVGEAPLRKEGARLPAVWVEGSTQGQWRLSLQPLPRSHTAHFPLYISGTPSPQAVVPPRAQGECLRASGSVRWPFKRTPGFLAAFCHTWVDGIPADFHRQMPWGLFFPALVLQTGEPRCGAGTPLSLGRTTGFPNFAVSSQACQEPFPKLYS